MTASVLQESSADDSFGSGTTITSAAFGANATVGSTIEVWLTCNFNSTNLPTTVLDSAAQSYTNKGVTFDSAGQQSLALYVLQNNASATKLTVTATYATAQSGKGIWSKEIGGVTSASYNNSNLTSISSPGTGANSITGTAITPSTSPVLCSALVMECSLGNGSDLAAGTGYAIGVSGWAFGGSNVLAKSESKRLTSVTSTAATATAATNGGSGSYLVGLAMYNEATGTDSAFADDNASFYYEDASEGPESDDFRNSDNLSNIQQWPADEWCFSADDECQSVDLWVEIASIEQPLIANGPPNVVQEDVIVDWWEGYEDPQVPDFEWSGPIQPNAPPASQFADQPWDFDSEAVETSASIESFQNSDVLQDQPSADAWDNPDDAFDELHLIVNADERVLSADFVVVAQQPQDIEWQDEDSEDFWFSDDVLGADVIPAAAIVADDPWSFEADYVEPTVTTEGFQNSDVVAPTDLVSPDAWAWDDDVPDESPDDAMLGANSAAPVTQPSDPDWTEEDGGEDYELQIDDFANFELDPPQPDGWDWDNESVEDSVDTEQVLGADVIPPVSQPQDIDWDFTESSDDDWAYDEAQQSPPIITADQHFGDDAENWDDSTVDESDGTRPDDYALVNGVAQPVQVFDDPWDWNEDSDAEPFGLEAQVSSDDFVREDGWDWNEEGGDEPFGLDAQTSADAPTDLAQPDSWDWDQDATESADEFSAPVGPDYVPPPSQFTDYGWEWNWDGDFAEIDDHLDPAAQAQFPVYAVWGPRYRVGRFKRRLFTVGRFGGRSFTVSATGLSQFDSKAPDEAVKLVFDFTPDLPAGVTLNGAPTITYSVVKGLDSNPSALQNGLPGFDVNSTQAIVPIHGGLDGVQYKIHALCATTDASLILSLSGTLSVLA